MNLPRSKLKNAFYILIALALVYVFLVNASLDNTIKEAITGRISDKPTPWIVFDAAGFDANGNYDGKSPPIRSETNAAPDINGDVSTELESYYENIKKYRIDLDDRLKDLKTNPPNKDIGYTTESYTTIVWATLGTVLLFLIFTELE
jgi:hypothetical protein